MTNAYPRLTTLLETLLMQMQGHAVVAALGTQDDDLIGEAVRADERTSGRADDLALSADADRTARFFACGMLGNTLTAIGLPCGAR
ncbi:hypothetical protein [Streptomyces sp. NPDC005244]|uniref:hypothetical protein n=1 Tax=Streptomyces sp. NPDC005244 TaxID=3364708 RepID=UPI0036BBF405